MDGKKKKIVPLINILLLSILAYFQIKKYIMNSQIIILLDISSSSIVPGILGYIDPGTGSIIIQAVVAAVVGVGIAVKLFWHRILKFLGIRKAVKSDNTINPKVKE